MTDNLQEILYGKTEKVTLADGKEYILREPCIDELESLQLDVNSKPDDIKTIKKLAWTLLKQDNKTLQELMIGRLITLSMMKEGSPFMNSITKVIGHEVSEKKG